jgi:radical SAM protein with 4Fe4S-binding SPASM domain
MIPLKITEYIKAKTILSSFPKILNLEVTNFCNLNCPMCIVKETREQGFLRLDLLEKIVKENRKLLENQFIWLHFNGEPLLHPQLFEIIEFLKQNGIKTRLSTNATLLTKEVAFELMKAGLDYIVFSVDGNTKETYEKIRVGANFETVERNILSFLRIKKKYNFQTKTQIQFIKMKENEKEVKDFIKKWKKTDINFINIKSFCSRAWRARELERFGEIEKLRKKIIKRPPCFYLWETLVILWNGEVIVCCQDLLGELKVGDVKKDTLLTIWNNKKMQELRFRQLKGDFSMNPCNSCPDWKYIPRTFIGYIAREIYRKFFKIFLQQELKDEGIRIIFNKL